MKRKWKLIFLASYVVLLIGSHIFRYFRPPPDLNPGQSSLVVNDKKLAYRDIGPRNAPTLLLVHGSPGASSIFDRVADELKYDFRLIIPDLPGFGRSQQKVDDLSIEAHADDLVEMIDQLKLEKVSLVGYSMGGGVAAHLTDRVSEKIDKVILLASIGVQDHELLGDYLLNHAIHGLQLAGISLIQEGVPHFGWWDDAFLNRNYARNFYETDQRPLRPLLEKWNGPTLIIHGENDRLVPPSAAREHARIIPQSTLKWIKNGNHIDLIRRPKQVAVLIDEFAKNPGLSRSEAAPARIEAAKKKPIPRRLDQTKAGAIATGTLLGIATLGSEDLACISGGILTSRGVIGFLTATLGCFGGIFFGDIFLFLLGKWFGSRAVERAPLKWIAPKEKIDAGRDWLNENGAKVIFATRFLPGSRLPIYVGMGAANISLKKFLFWFFIAAAIWTPILVGIAALFGQALLPWFEENEKLILPGILGIIVFLLCMVKLVSCVSTWKGRRLLVSRWKRITHWEFWPAWILYLALFPYLAYLALKHRSGTVFAAANPALPCGGLALEPKLISLNALESSASVANFTPVENPEDVFDFLESESFDYPVVIKPDIGERGRGVAIAKSPEDVETYFSVLTENDIALAQEFVGGPEFGVFYYRYPEKETGRIFAVTQKEMLTVKGDGKETLEELILRHPRAICMAPVFLKRFEDELENVIPKGKIFSLTSLGTHSRGALFLDGAELITPELETEIDRISQHFEGFHFGRFDLKAPSVDDFKKGKKIRIIELNGVTSEATGMYDPKHSFFAALATLQKQWKICFDIGAQNRERGSPVPTVKDIFQNIREYRKMNRYETPVR